MIVLAIDPGSKEHGCVLADCSGDLPVPEVVHSAASTRQAIELMRLADRVFVERFAPGKTTGWSSALTAEAVGGFVVAAAMLGKNCHLFTRSEWLRLIRVKYGAGADGRVRRYVITAHGGVPDSRNRKDLPGALKGVTAHAWQAMGLMHAGLVSLRGR